MHGNTIEEITHTSIPMIDWCVYQKHFETVRYLFIYFIIYFEEMSNFKFQYIAAKP